MNSTLKLLLSLFKGIMYRFKRVSVHPTSLISGKLDLAEYVSINKFCSIHNTRIGKFSYVSKSTILKDCSIGKFCSIGPDCLIGGLGTHPINWMSTHPVFYSSRNQVEISIGKQTDFKEIKETSIGNDVWLGARVVVLDGVNIGDGAIVATGAIVTRDIDPYTLVGGVPAREIRKRFSEEIINKLIKLKWWEQSLETLKLISSHYFCEELTEDLLKRIEVEIIRHKIKK